LSQRFLGETPDLNALKREGHELLAGVRGGLPEALERVRRTGREPGRNFGLLDALKAIAREHGFDSWQRLRQHAAYLRTPEAAAERGALKAAFEGEPKPADLPQTLAMHCVLGNLQALRGAIAADRRLADRPCGALGLKPLVYVCFSKWVDNETARECASLLLQNGADPNASRPWEWNPATRLSVLYAAVGPRNDPELARMLLDAGADPNDNESLYHSAEHRDHACLRLLLDRGARVEGTNAVCRMLDYDDPVGLDLLLAKVRNLREDPSFPVHHAIGNGRSGAIVRRLLEAGADPEAVRPTDGLSPLRLAVRLGNEEAASALEQAGADPSAVTALDRWIGAISRGDVESAQAMAREDPSLVRQLGATEWRMLPDAAFRGDAAAVRGFAGMGWPLDARGVDGGTALHCAAWVGAAECVRILLEAGADVHARGDQHDSTPLHWACHGSQNCPHPVGSHVECVRLLLAAGAVPERLEGTDEVRRVLESAMG